METDTDSTAWPTEFSDNDRREEWSEDERPNLAWNDAGCTVQKGTSIQGQGEIQGQIRHVVETYSDSKVDINYEKLKTQFDKIDTVLNNEKSGQKDQLDDIDFDKLTQEDMTMVFKAMCEMVPDLKKQLRASQVREKELAKKIKNNKDQISIMKKAVIRQDKVLKNNKDRIIAH